MVLTPRPLRVLRRCRAGDGRHGRAAGRDHDPTIEPVAAVEAIAAALIAIAVAIGLAHHRRGAFLVRIDAHRYVAQHVFVQALLPLDLGQRGGRGVELEQGEMRLAVLADAERERLDAPVFRIADELAAEAFETPLKLAVISSTCCALRSWRAR